MNSKLFTLVEKSNEQNMVEVTRICHLTQHPTGRALTSESSVNSFMIVVYENIFYLWFEQKILTDHSKTQTTIIKLFTD